MKSLATLQAMSRNMSEIARALRQAVLENLKELGTEVPVRSDEDHNDEDDEDERKGLYVYGPGKYGSLYEYRVDKVKAGENGILCHYCECDEREADSWNTLEEFYDADCIIDAIQWPDTIEQGKEENCNSIMVLYFVDEDNTKDILLAATAYDLETGTKRDEIEKKLRETFNIDERKEWEDIDPEGVERGLQEAAVMLAKGEQAYFDTYDFAWEKVTML